jgi:hypothetical protein
MFSCEILFSEFLSILKTSQVQAEMFEDMTRILIQNCQSSGRQTMAMFVDEHSSLILVNEIV